MIGVTLRFRLRLGSLLGLNIFNPNPIYATRDYDDPMQMIWHYDKFVNFGIGKVTLDLIPIITRDFPYSR